MLLQQRAWNAIPRHRIWECGKGMRTGGGDKKIIHTCLTRRGDRNLDKIKLLLTGL